MSNLYMRELVKSKIGYQKNQNVACVCVCVCMRARMLVSICTGAHMCLTSMSVTLHVEYLVFRALKIVNMNKISKSPIYNVCIEYFLNKYLPIN